MRPVTKVTIFGLRLAVVVLAAYWVTIFLGTHLPQVLVVSPNMNDKAQHFAAFFVLGVLMCYTTNSDRWMRRFGVIVIAGIIYAAIDELTQYFVPGRYPDAYDFLADTVGLSTAIAIYMAAKYGHGSWLAPPTRGPSAENG